MHSFYHLSFSEDTLPFVNQLYRVSSSTLQLYGFYDNKLYSYQYNNGTWQGSLIEHINAQQLYFTDVLENGQNTLITRSDSGFNFYRCQHDYCRFLSTIYDHNAHYIHSIDLINVTKFGHFYNNINLVGILANHQEYGIRFYKVRRNFLYNNLIELVNTDLSILGDSSQMEFFLADLKQRGQENIIAYGKEGLNIYEFNQYDELERLMQVPNSGKLDDSKGKLFFPNLTGQSYQDIVLLNTSGLFIYQYNNEQRNYRPIYYGSRFAELKGWNTEHINSIQFEDINLDGRQDMFFTGPQGINLLSFDNHTNQWQPLLDNSQLNIAQRHNNVIKVIPANPPITECPVVFTQYKNQSYWANITEVEEEIEPEVVEQPSSQTLTSPVIPQILQQQLGEEKPISLLRDQLDCSSIFDAVDKNTGKPIFKLPLINLSNLGSEIKLDFVYNGNNKISGILGFGWSLPQNLIMMDHQSSIFPEDEKYYIILQGLPQQLMFDSSNSTDNVHSFKLSNDQSDLQICYYKDEERWEIDSKGIKQTYGRIENADSIDWELTWKNWRGVGSSSKGQEQLATAWYLAEVKDKNNNTIRYTYDIVNVAVQDGKNFTREIYLKTISDNQENEIIFNYFNKDVSEYELLPLVDKEGNLNTQRVQTRYLKGYTVTTPNYQQSINFVHRVENGKRFLTKIKQEGDITGKPILRFSYEEVEESHMLGNVILPTGASVKFDYQLLDPIINEEKERRYDHVWANYAISYDGSDILIVHESRQWGAIFTAFGQEIEEKMEKKLYVYNESEFVDYRLKLINPLGPAWVWGDRVKRHEIVRAEGFLVIILYYDTGIKKLYSFHKEEGRWLFTPGYYNFNKDAIIRPGEGFIAVVGINSIKIIDLAQWKIETLFWINDPSSLLAVFRRILLFYDDDSLSIGYKNHNNKWESKVIKAIPGVVNDIKETLGKFDLESELYDQLLNYFKNTALQLNNNLLLLSRWRLEGAQLYTIIDLFVLNSRYEIVQEQQYKVTQDDLSKFTKELKNKKGDIYIVGYGDVDNKFRVVIKSLDGPTFHKMKQDLSKRDYTRKIDEISDEILDSLRKTKTFFLDIRKYPAILSSNTVICNNKKFTFTGDGWNEQTISEAELKQEKLSIPLGSKFILNKENSQSSFKLYDQGNNGEKQGNSLLDLNVKQLNQTLIRYPVYLAYQRDNTQADVVKFSSDGSSVERIYALPKEEKLSPWSSYQMLVTSIDTKQNGTTLVFRSQFVLRPSPVITKIKVSFDNSKRITGYEYSGAKALGNIVYYEKTSLIPGNDKASFGWIEEIKDFSNQSRLERKIFNSQGELIKTLKLAEEKTSANDIILEEENLYLNTTLFDKTGKLEVAQFFPYEIADEEVGYYGFEDYEVNRVDAGDFLSGKRWLFDETDVVKQNFSFTGQNYLSLSGKALVGTFQPNSQNQEYVASCWVRQRSEMFKLGAVTPYLKVIVSTESGDEVFGLLSRVQFQSGNWFYLEVVIDLLYAEQIYKGLQTSIGQSNTKFRISVVVGPGVNTTIDVDYVRFFPLNSHFQANVYNLKTKQITEVISASGLVKRYIYDKYQKQIASINEYGQLEGFNTYTKASSIGKITELRSNIQIQPESRFYENFAPYSFHERWKINDANAWQISPGQLQHLTNSVHNLQLGSHNISPVSYGVRLCFSLQSESVVIKFNNDLQMMRTNDKAVIVFSEKRQSIPLDGEILIVVEHSRLFVWIDGGLYVDNEISSSNDLPFSLEISGKVKISDLMIFSEPSVLVTYFNTLDEKLQEIVLESGNTAIVREYLYDELGRQTITTQPARMERSNGQPVLAHYPNFVTNSNPYSTGSVWKIHQLKGEVSEVVGKHGYSQIKYDNNPLNEKSAIGLPGKRFSGVNAERFSSSCQNSSINNLFPSSKGYSCRAEYRHGGIRDILVFDDKNNKVAWYFHGPRSKDLLSTYEYDENDRLVKSLPPLYREKVRTLHKQNLQQQSISREERLLQKSLGTHISYDERGNIIAKITPDSGKVEYLYGNDGLRKFTVQYSKTNEIENVIYFNYDQLGRLSIIGKLTSLAPKEELLTLTLTDNNTQVYQKFYHDDFEHEPIIRGKLKRTVTFNDGEPFIEESILDMDKKIISKRIIIPVEDNYPLMVAINKKYIAGKLREIEYPINIQGKPLRFIYQYNKLGKVTGIGTPDLLLVKFTYNAAGQVVSEQHLANNFTRQYSYNSPGFLTILEDKFLTEKIHYAKGSYGDYGYSYGTITRTEFEATWHEHCDNSKLGLNERSFVSENIIYEESASCFRKLKQQGYLDRFSRQAKIYYPDSELIDCSYKIASRQIQSTLGREGFPAKYGYSYYYSDHQELIKAKYFVGSEVSTPLQPDTFAKEIPGINGTASHDIWEILRRDSGYLVDDSSLDHSERRKSFIRSMLFGSPRNLDTDEVSFEMLFGTYSSQREKLSMLESDLQDALERYRLFIPGIAQVLLKHFANRLGEAEFDIEYYDIDANGNHKYYYAGFDRYDLSYRSNTNQVNSVKFKSYASSRPSRNFSVKHDSRGNVIQALHKGIEHIDYNQVSNRPTKIQLTDGKTLTFYYDAQGERVLKRVTNSEGQITKEIHYIRDEFGRALVERQITYISQDLPPDVLVTAYIYGPKGLLGFIRRDEFYSVITDHEGSIRLVVKGDEVVAAYDYLPYGNLMRKYGSDPEAHISYRYTGQEWDEETGLYNYHARFYDPRIGRFYQVDPKGQYFSPYKYAGNSPVSVVDPDGEFALLIILGITGAYLGGATANDDWNLVNWEWDSGKTWVGMIGGGIGGALLPVGFVGSVGVIGYGATIGLGTSGAYLGMAAANNEWDPSKWDYSSPATWSGGFQGFAVGSGAAGGFSSAKTFYQGLSSNLGKGTFIVGSTATGGGLFVMNGFAANWDFSKPGVYYGFVDAITGAPDLPMFMRSAGKFLAKQGRQIREIRKILTDIRNGRANIRELKQPLLATGKVALGTAGIGVSAYTMGAAVSENGWDMNSVGTYHALVNGMLMGSQLFSIGKHAYRMRTLRKKANVEEKSEAIKKAEMISRRAAEDTVAEYKRAIESVKQEAERTANTDSNGEAGDSSRNTEGIMRVFDPNRDELPYNSGVRTALKEGRIPNAAVGVVTTNDLAVVAFSTSNAPGFISVYSHDKLNNLMYLHGRLQDSNSVIAQREVTLSSNAELNQRLMNDIEHAKRVIIADNVKKFDDRITKGSLSRLLDTLPNDVKNNIIKDLREAISEKGYLAKSSIDTTIRKRLIEQDPVIKEISDNLRIKQDESQIKEEKIKTMPKEAVEEKKSLNSEKKNIVKKIKELEGSLKERKKIIGTEQEQLAEKFWEQVKDFYGGLLVNRDPTNCAEPHAITALSRMDEIVSNNNIEVLSRGNEHVSIRMDDRAPLISRPVHSYDRSEDIRFLATYKLTDQNSLESFPRCDYCLITTKHIKHVVTDPLYQEILKNFGKLEHNKKRLYFLMPYNDMTSRLYYISARDEDDVSNRTRRSAFNKRAEMENESSYGGDVDNKVTSSGVRLSSPINNFFGWVTAKVKSLIGLTYNNALPVPIQVLPKGNAPTESVSNKGWSSSRRKVEESTNFEAALPKGTSSTASSISQVYAQPDTTGLMLLAPILMNTMGRKFVFPLLSADQPIPLSEVHGHALNIKEGFEKAVKQAASKSGISMHRLKIDFVGVEKEIAGKIIGGKFNEIPGILSSYVEKACPSREAGCPGKLSLKKFDKFMTEFNNKLNIILIPQILNDKNSILDIKEQQENSEPESYLGNVSVSGHLTQIRGNTP